MINLIATAEMLWPPDSLFHLIIIVYRFSKIIYSYTFTPTITINTVKMVTFIDGFIND